MDILYGCYAGLDFHKKTVVACRRRLGRDGQVEQDTRTFATMTADLLALADWRAEAQVTHVAMESTGIYWRPVWHLLEDLARLVNRLQKVLESANINLASVATDVLGASGRAMIDKLVAGEHDAAILTAEARGTLRLKAPALRQALHGRMTPHHRFQLRLLMDQIRQLEDWIARLDGRVAEVMERAAPGEPDRPPPLAEAARRVATIPGVGRRVAEVIEAEIGPDVRPFATAGHMASWAGSCSGNHQSGGKRLNGRTSKGNQALRVMLVQAAWAASHTKETALSATYRKLAKRLGKKKALVALGHKLLRIIYQVLSRGVEYIEHYPASQAA